MASTAPPATGTPAEAAPYLALQSAWADWLGAAQNRLPLSGDVTQWIKTWSDTVGQVGLLNVNIAGSANPALEKRIGSQYSYGRQLGRILDVLAPLVAQNEQALRERAGDAAVEDFQEMAQRIERMKRRSVEDLVDEVKRWRGAADFDERLASLQQQLAALAAGPGGRSR
jgi:hypothetical protein